MFIVLFGVMMTTLSENEYCWRGMFVGIVPIGTTSTEESRNFGHGQNHHLRDKALRTVALQGGRRQH